MPGLSNSTFDLFSLADEHNDLRAVLRDLCEVEIAPYAADVGQQARFPEEASQGAQRHRVFGGARDVAMEVTADAVQLFGGAGYTQDFPVERMMRDAKITQIYEGTNQIRRVVMARALLA
jgi:alkylation response protein AidB-like acyl-CoA dehydrogenase